MSTVIKNEDSLMNNLPNDEYPSDEVSRSSPDRFVGGGSVGTGVSLRQVTKKFGDVVAVNSVTLDIDQNEFFSILGPSGCGKTTLMRMIAGFERPSSGSIALLGESV